MPEIEPESHSGKITPKRGGISAPPPRTSYYEAIHCYRKVKTYPIQEHELSALDESNSNFTLWASLGTGFIFLSIGCVWDTVSEWSFTGVRFFFMVLFGLAAGGSFWVSRGYKKQRENRLKNIKAEVVEHKEDNGTA
ncbi:hypothetical protein HAHE_20570 [Haloferula helveola]|uniref:Uncharacterized protein n=1 Tax=Haloferula helveola TaxID=490095 RepID=A0ABM7REN1_9BACT|nr:hypothetical protein HAHE_20570 [Haloferula helveola]